jgi:ABC-type phosphate transport system permease subunit
LKFHSSFSDLSAKIAGTRKYLTHHYIKAMNPNPTLHIPGLKRRGVAMVPAVIGAFVVIMVIITVFLAWGYFVGVYNTAGGLNASLTNSSPQVAQQLNSFFTQINSLFGLLILVPLLAILGLIIVILVGWGGGRE